MGREFVKWDGTVDLKFVTCPVVINFNIIQQDISEVERHLSYANNTLNIGQRGLLPWRSDASPRKYGYWALFLGDI